MITNLLSSPYDLSACLTNCSNNGQCSFDIKNSKFICICSFDYYTGTKCEIDKRPCSSFQCFNNGTCLNKINETTQQYDFECQCQYPYYSRRCESKINLCQINSTCVPNQGLCIINGTQTACKCFTGYSGDFCEIMSSSLQTAKAISNISALVAIILIICFMVLIVLSDLTKLFPKKAKIKSKKIKKIKPIQNEKENDEKEKKDFETFDNINFNKSAQIEEKPKINIELDENIALKNKRLNVLNNRFNRRRVYDSSLLYT